MGIVFSSNNTGTFVQTLEQENCPHGHPIWDKVNISFLSGFSYSPLFHSSLIKIKAKYPENYANLVDATVVEFAKAAKLSESEGREDNGYINVCDFICMLLSSETSDNSYWFKMPKVYLTALSPISTVIQTIQKLLKLSQPVNTILGNNNLIELKIGLLKTMGFIANKDAIGDYGKKNNEPSKFLLSLDLFQSNTFIPPLLNLMPYVICNGRHDSHFQLIRAAICFAVPCLYSCGSWKLNNVDQNLINKCFLPLSQLVSGKLSKNVIQKVIAMEEFYVSFLFVIMLKFKTFTEFISVYGLSNNYVASLLYLFQNKYENEQITFFHSIVLLTLSRITSIFPALLQLNEPFNGVFNTNYKFHRGTYADLLIEIITNPLIDDFKKNISLINIIMNIILNISSTTISFSCFSANRIFKLLNKIITSKSIEKHEHSQIISQILLSIYQIFRFQPLGNIYIFMFCSENIKIIELLAKNNKWKNYAERIIEIISSCEQSLSIKNEKLKLKTIQESIAPVLNQYEDEPSKQIEYPLSERLKSIWIDWFRVLYWVTFPEESDIYGLRFKCFEIPRNIPQQNQYTEQRQPVDDKSEIHLPNISVTINEEQEKPATPDDNLEVFIGEDSPAQSSKESQVIKQQEIHQIEEEINEDIKQIEIADNPFGEEDELAKFLED